MQKGITDFYLGTIKYSEEKIYKGKFELDKKTIEFYSYFNTDEDLEEMLKSARSAIKNISNNYNEFKLYIAEQLLDLYNDDWSEAEVIDREKFARRISLDSVMIYDRDSVEIYDRDADLFAEHFIAVDLTSEGKLEEPYLAG